MDFTLRSYLGNPYGKGNTTIPNLSAIKDQYLGKMNKMKDQIFTKWYQVKAKSLVCLMTVPSESVEGIHYDVVFEFDISKGIENINTVMDLPLKDFSNSPSFSYTYANVFLKNKILCEWLKGKYNKAVRRKEAEARNASHIIGFEKTLYLGSLFLSMNGNSDIVNIMTHINRVSSTTDIEKSVLDQDDVERKYRDTKRMIKEQKEKDKKKALEKPQTNNKNRENVTKTIGTIGKTKTGAVTSHGKKNVKTIKSSKKI